MSKTTGAVLFTACFAFALPASAGVITWDFGASGAADLGGSATFSAGGVDITADAFVVDDTSDATFTNAFILQTSGGLNICRTAIDLSTGLCTGGDNRQIDDHGPLDLLRFDLGNVDQAISASMTGTSNGDAWEVRGSNSAELAIAAMTLIDSGVEPNVTADLTGSTFRYLFFMGRVDGNATDDYRVKTLVASVPEASTLALFGIGLAGFGWMGRRSQYAQRHPFFAWEP